jgi:alkylation response protein AidB-like acyl-CoA dehydrogenase
MASQASAKPAAALTVTDYLDRVARAAPAIAEAAEQIERDRKLPPELLSVLHRERLFRLLLPRDYDGEQVDPPTFFQIMMAIAACDGSVAWCICQANGCAMTAAFLEPAAAQEIWGSDPNAVLAWGPPGKPDVKVTDDGFIVSGSWSFASGSAHATWLGGHSTFPGPDGETVNRTMLMPADVVKMKDVWHVLGLNGTSTNGYSVSELFVPYNHSVSRDDPAERRVDAPNYYIPTTNLYATGFSATALGIARAILDSFKELAGEKQPYRTKNLLRDNGMVQAEVALCEARLGSARAFMLSEVSDVWEDTIARGEFTIDSRVRIRLASTYAIHEAKAVADAAYDAAGATAIFKSNPFERRFRDIHTVTQQIQGRRLHFQNVGAYMLGKDVEIADV